MAADEVEGDPERAVRPARPKKIQLWWVVLGVFGALLAVLAGGLLYLSLHADRIAGEIVDGIPVDQENILGDLALVDIGSRMRLRDSGPAADAVRNIGERLTVGSRFKYRWYVGERSQVNAVSVPGGVVVIFSGLIEVAGSPEELAGVIAHEVAHAELRHGLRASVKGLGLTGLLKLMLGDNPAGSLGGRLGQWGGLAFSREHEAEADADGLRRLLAAGIDPEGMVRVFDRLARPVAGVAAASSLTATHPATAARIAGLRTAIARDAASANHRATVPLNIDWRAVQESLRRPRP